MIARVAARTAWGLVAVMVVVALAGCPTKRYIEGVWTVKALYTGDADVEYQERWVLEFMFEDILKWSKDGATATGAYAYDQGVITIDRVFTFPGPDGSNAQIRLVAKLDYDEDTKEFSGPFTMTLLTPHPGNDSYSGTLEGTLIE